MDFTATGWMAVYDPQQARGGVLRPVEAWGPEGEALVVDETSGRLRPATAFTGFKTLQKVSKVVGAMPSGNGWKLRITEDQDGDFMFDVPIIAWVIDDSGNLIPVTVTEDSYLSPPGNRKSRILPA